jgi:tetratricopeptide (TPR) repeat protein
MTSGTFVGRVFELSQMNSALDNAVGGKGSATVISGEPGIGKTELLMQCLGMARLKGMKVLSGGASQDTSEPFQVFTRALGGHTDAPLLDQTETVSFSGVFLTTDSGEISARAMSGEMDPERIAATMNAVQSFVGDSFRSTEGSIGRMTFGDMTILAERCGDAIITGVIDGVEHPEMAKSLRIAAAEISQRTLAPEDAVQKVAHLKFSKRKDMSGVKLASERNRLADRTLDLLSKATGNQPVLMVFEDMHWADEISLFVFAYLARISPRMSLSIIATARPSETELWDGEINNLVNEGAVSIIPLVRMDGDSVRKLVDAVYSPNRFPAEFYANLARDCSGNPLFTSEMVNQMAAEGGIILRDGVFELVDTHHSMPERIEDIVMRKLDTLNPHSLAAAEHLSCAGREFPAGILNSLKNVNNPEAVVDELSSAGILQSNGDNLQFRHAMFRDAIYKNISARWRANYHKDIGEYYEREHAGSTDAVIYELARHFFNSNEKAKAFDYCFRAGESAEGSYAAERAVEFYKCAMEVLPASKLKSPGEKEIELLERTGDMQMLVSKFSEAIVSYSAAISKSAEDQQKVKLYRKKADVLWKTGDYDSSLAEMSKGEALTTDKLDLANFAHQRAYIYMRRGEFDRAIELSTEQLCIIKDEKSAEALRASIYDTLASCHHRKGEYETALDYYGKCLAMQEALGNLRRVGSVLNNIGNVYGDRFQNEKASQYYDRSMEIFRKIGDKQAVSVLTANLAAIHYSTGNLIVAEQMYGESRAVSKEIGDLRMYSANLANLGVVHNSMGDYRQSIALFEDAMKIWADMGDQMSEAWGLSSIGAAHYELGDCAKAKEFLEKSHVLSEKIGDKWKLCGACLYLAELKRTAGDLAGARQAHEKTYELATALDSKDMIVESLAGLAEIDIREGNHAAAQDRLESAVKMAEDSGLRVELAIALKVFAKLRAAMGKGEEAEAMFSRAFEIHKGIQNNGGRAKLLYEWGVKSMREGNIGEGTERLKSALQIFRASGMEQWVLRTESALSGELT